MQVRPEEVPPQQPIYEQIPQGTINISDLTASLVSDIKIPDTVMFEHQFYRDTSCGKLQGERSEFIIDGLGRLVFGYTITHQCPQTNCCDHPCCVCCQCCNLDCDAHSYPIPDYFMKNDILSMQYWNEGVGEIFVKDLPVLKFLDSNPNKCDTFYGHCRSGYPKQIFSFPLDPQKSTFLLTPDPSPCPETIVGICGELAIWGVCKSSRQFHVRGLTQGTCTILNTRGYYNAWATINLMQGADYCCGCPHVDYPSFTVNFTNVQTIDKIAILMGLVHYNIIKKWYVMTTIKHTLQGLA